MSNKKILVIGATGAMGQYLVPRLLDMGYSVDAVAKDTLPLIHSNLHSSVLDGYDEKAVAEQLKKGYHGIVDFMLYGDDKRFEGRIPMFLDNTDHYIFLSTYRTYANEERPIKETSPLLIDVLSPEEQALNYNDYCLYKAREERLLHASGRKNYTIIRPAITYSIGRYQLTTLEAPVLIPRIREGKTVLLPEEAMNVQATMSWAGDIATMISRLLLNPANFGETFTVSTAEHHSWETIAEYYRKLTGMKYVTIPKEEFLGVWGTGGLGNRWQLCYDRLFERIMDNTKILGATGMKQSELKPLYEGLELVLNALGDRQFAHSPTNDRMDAYIEKHHLA